jgi:hypothetical protein
MENCKIVLLLVEKNIKLNLKLNIFMDKYWFNSGILCRKMPTKFYDVFSYKLQIRIYSNVIGA